MSEKISANSSPFIQEVINGLLIFVIVILFLIIEITDSYYLRVIESVLIYTFIIKSIFNLKGPIAKIIYVLLGLTIFIILSSDNIIDTLTQGALLNLPIVTILVLTPLIGIPVKVGGYIPSLKQVIGKYKNNVLFFYIVFLLLTHMFSIILNMGSVLINLHLMESSNVRSKRLTANILNRGFTSINIWSPYLGAMVLVLDQLNIEWFTFVSYTFYFVLFSLIVAVIVELGPILKEQKRLNELEIFKTEIEVINKKEVSLKIIELIFLVLISMVLVLVIDRFTNINIVLSISFVSILFPLIWCFLKEELSKYKKETFAHITKTIPNLQTEFTLFLVAGLFSYSFAQSSLNSKSVDIINGLFGHSALLITIVISATIIITGILGVHPIVLLTLFATSIVPEEIGLSAIHFGALLLGSVGIANTISPATAVNNLLAKTLNQEIYTVSLKWNWIYALTLFLSLPVYLIFFST